jgi:hypothetical protein
MRINPTLRQFVKKVLGRIIYNWLCSLVWISLLVVSVLVGFTLKDGLENIHLYNKEQLAIVIIQSAIFVGLQSWFVAYSVYHSLPELKKAMVR